MAPLLKPGFVTQNVNFQCVSTFYEGLHTNSLR
jgi:hypothetical protein